MAKLLWQLVQGNYSEEHFFQRLTLDMGCLTEDVANCAKVLVPIQKPLRLVLRGIEEITRRDSDLGQGDWGEEWFLPPEQAEYVRKQLSKAKLGLLEKSSEYQEAMEAHLETYICVIAKFIDIPISEPNRSYIGVVTNTLEQHKNVWIEGSSFCQLLVNASRPCQYPTSDVFGWGYSGGGPGHLATSILADAMEGDLDVPQECCKKFQHDVVERLPMGQPFRISRAEVLEWLEEQGVGQQELQKYGERLRQRKGIHSLIVNRLKEKLKKAKSYGGLRAQRFDAVPPDFECSLYLNLMDMLRWGKRILRCSWCELPIPYDGSGRSNRQRARWLAGKPIYHEHCWQEKRVDQKRTLWRRRAAAPEFKEERRKRARECRRIV